jgi:hypothetical protein
MQGLMVHCGGTKVSFDDVRAIAAPAATATHVPLPHHELVGHLIDSLNRTGFEISAENHAIAKNGNQYFGLFQLFKPDMGELGYTSVVGLRNSHDKSLPAGIVAGSQVFVCDNLSFSGEFKITKKHTAKVRDNIDYAFYKAMGAIRELFTKQDTMYLQFKQTELARRDSDHLLLELLRQDVVPQGKFKKLVEEWHTPTHAEHTAGGETVWRMFNAVTESLKSDADVAIVELPRRTQKATKVFADYIDAEYSLAQAA